jgi:hypothetical protein
MSKARDLANAGTALTTVSATELGYLDGVTSAVQTQIDSKITGSSAIAPTIVDAKGDIIAATAADTVSKLTVGANATVLTADSAEATGLKWATPAAGGMTLLSTTTLSGAATTISSINQTYTNLQVVFSNITLSGGDDVLVYANATTGIIDRVGQRMRDSTVVNQAGHFSNIQIPFLEGLSTNTDNAFVLDIYNYTATTRIKPFQVFGSSRNPDVQQVAGIASGGIVTNSAITSITFDVSGAATFTGGTVLVYGVK